ncbi:MAG: CarD family transcriptional regulator [Lachnospiraceae bacterium]|nr:CarD family transcriptional regulator [Lachnospiraceae bacterium]MBQ7602074.1 CarD family transcriptional regulator [Lachnospiraceae bacterium]MBR6977864.1 CarD family transcriptional regulator [Lachnospiraceae bacterium]
MIHIGDYVVKMNEGVCRVDSELLLDSYQDKRQVPYYLLLPVANDRMRVYVPVAEEYSDLRLVMNKTEARNLIREIGGIEATEVENDRLREQVYKDALKSLDPKRLVGILKCMHDRGEARMKQGKKKTAVDDRYQKLAETALCQELGFVLEKKPAEIHEMLLEQTRSAL